MSVSTIGEIPIEELNRIHEQRKEFVCDVHASDPIYYSLAMFPYTSGKLHMGHVRVYVINDVRARYKRLKGYTVLNPIGWDAFGLPAENAAIENRVKPDVWTKGNIDRMTGQLRQLGCSFDWEKQLATSSPDYYRWTQWIFLQLYKHGKAYKKPGLVNWCTVDKTVLANEQVIEGRCWRDGSVVEKRYMDQWFIRISDYAERMWNGLSTLKNWAKDALAVQRNWINQSRGCEIRFPVEGTNEHVSVFTTRADTLFGVSAIVLAPEHPLVGTLAARSPNEAALLAYSEASLKKSSVERVAGAEKTGVDTGALGIHPLTGFPVPIWVADFVLGEYGTGAVMCVPAHDQRDYEFARMHGLPIVEVIRPDDPSGHSLEKSAYEGEGTLVSSGQFTGIHSAEARTSIAETLERAGSGRRVTVYNLRDWSVGRQRYWGCPIPIVYCSQCGTVPVPESDLPVLLPSDVEIEEGRVSIKSSATFQQTICPSCGGPAERETDTLDTFMDSAWYAFRFIDSHNADAIFDSTLVNKWMPINFYVGALEHAAQHMIYFRFLAQFFHEIGLTRFAEPVDQFFCNGFVTKNGEKMSKSKGNVVTPDDMIAVYGLDALRMYILSDSPPEFELDWNDSGIKGKADFVARNYRALSQFLAAHCIPTYSDSVLGAFLDQEFLFNFFGLVVKCEDNIESNQYHNAVARLHEISNTLLKQVARAGSMSDNDRGVLVRLIREFLIVSSPVIPVFAESLLIKYMEPNGSIYHSQWPKVDSVYRTKRDIELVVQVNGKARHIISVMRDAPQKVVEKLALDAVSEKYLGGRPPTRIIYIPNRVVNIVAPS